MDNAYLISKISAAVFVVSLVAMIILRSAILERMLPAIFMLALIISGIAFLVSWIKQERTEDETKHKVDSERNRGNNSGNDSDGLNG